MEDTTWCRWPPGTDSQQWNRALQSYNFRELNSANNLNEFGIGVFSELPGKDTQPRWHINFSLAILQPEDTEHCPYFLPAKWCGSNEQLLLWDATFIVIYYTASENGYKQQEGQYGRDKARGIVEMTPEIARGQITQGVHATVRPLDFPLNEKEGSNRENTTFICSRELSTAGWTDILRKQLHWWSTWWPTEALVNTWLWNIQKMPAKQTEKRQRGCEMEHVKWNVAS
jgi:hypothetical protein